MAIVIPERLLPLPMEQVYTNSRAKINPRTGEVMEICTASRAIYKARKDVVERRPEGRKRCSAITPEAQEVWEVEEASEAWLERKEKAGGEAARRAASRAKRRLFDLASCNDFDLFFTLTLSPEEIDRHDYKAAVRKLSQWLDNRVRRRGLRYVAVPELHKDGAIHFHGLCNAAACRLVDSGHKDKRGKVIYNLADWSLGFTTAVMLDGDYAAVCRYVSKYISKQQSGGTIGGRYFYHGGALQEPVYRYFNSTEPDGSKAVEIPDAGLTLYYWPAQMFDGGKDGACGLSDGLVCAGGADQGGGGDLAADCEAAAPGGGSSEEAGLQSWRGLLVSHCGGDVRRATEQPTTVLEEGWL